MTAQRPGTALQEWKEFDNALGEFLGKADDAKLWGDGGGVESARVTLEIRRACRQTPALRKCTFESIGRAALDAYAAGLVPDGREGYLIPRYNKHALGNNQGAHEAHFMAAWRGLQALACEGEGGRPGAFRSITAEVVRVGDDFKWEGGIAPTIHHVPDLEKMGPIYAAYAVGFPPADSPEPPVFVVVDRGALNRAKDKGGPVWRNNEPAMARKTAVRRLLDKVVHTPTARARMAAATRAFDRLAEVADSERDPDTGQTPLAKRAEAAKAEGHKVEEVLPESPSQMREENQQQPATGPVGDGEIVDDDPMGVNEPEPVVNEPAPPAVDVEPEPEIPGQAEAMAAARAVAKAHREDRERAERRTRKPSPEDIEELRQSQGLFHDYQDPGDQ